MAEQQRKILCIGEILWDALPSGLFLGGAPLNVCYHLNQLGISVEMCSRVGGDRLGKEALRRIQRNDMSTAHIQTDGQSETGFVEVEVTSNGEPSYTIIEPVAWDFIEPSPSLKQAVRESWGIVFGSLAQRNEQSRDTIQNLWKYADKKILDLNLRPPHIDRTVIRDSLAAADIIKMNEAELEQIKKWFSLSGSSCQIVETLAEKFECSFICITKGPAGAMLFEDGSWSDHRGYKTDAKDSVGAGDAFLATMIYGVQCGKKGKELLKYANAAGSFVAQKSGATPEYDIHSIEEIVMG
ncbi:carbohydrate kinase [Aliifodinibius salicampi]|uniref:Carbohydrate kinase n=1 Tax=Fodinibius salicampi TaxID=1920655 RepID=A0ABT3PX10_9BACT|nr:carbohydrate kinase [Fodinibius salicampi]MCW9712389.1 carbohydrate kinase [Fodinibius salicampi]